MIWENSERRFTVTIQHEKLHLNVVNSRFNDPSFEDILFPRVNFHNCTKNRNTCLLHRKDTETPNNYAVTCILHSYITKQGMIPAHNGLARAPNLLFLGHAHDEHIPLQSNSIPNSLVIIKWKFDLNSVCILQTQTVHL